MWCRATLVVVLLLNIYSVSSEPLKKSILKDNCDYSFSPKCIKLDLLRWLDNVAEEESVSVLPGVELVRGNDSTVPTTEELVKETSRVFPNDPEARLDAALWKKASGFVNSHSLKVNWDDFGDVGTARGRGGGGGGKKGGGGGGGLGYLLAAAAVAKSTLFAVALKGIALIAGKALFVGAAALLISAIIGLKSLTSHTGGHTTHEVITKPIVTHSADHGSGWGRVYNEVPLPMGLQPGYRPE